MEGKENLVKFGMALVLGVAEVLDLGHGELAHADQTRARRDLVAERVADLSGGERQLRLSTDKSERKTVVTIGVAPRGSYYCT